MKYFNKEWYNNECKHMVKNDVYLNYMKAFLPEWYNV